MTDLFLDAATPATKEPEKEEGTIQMEDEAAELYERLLKTHGYEFVSEGVTRLAGLKSGKYDLITNLPP